MKKMTQATTKKGTKKTTTKSPTKTATSAKPTKTAKTAKSEKSAKIILKSLDEQCDENPVVKKIIDATNEIIDPEIGIGIVDLGLIYGVTLDGRRAIITMTLTSMGCPVGPMIVEQIETLVPQIVDEIDHADVVITWEPAWSPERMKPDIRDMLFNF